MLNTPEGGMQPRERRWTGRRSGTDRRHFDRRLFDRRQNTMPAAIERRQRPRRRPGLERRVAAERRSVPDRRGTGRRTVASIQAALASVELSLELVREAEQLEAPLRTRLIDELAHAAQGIRRATGMWRTRPTEMRKFQ
jgi:hypothetical protein